MAIARTAVSYCGLNHVEHPIAPWGSGKYFGGGQVSKSLQDNKK